MKKAFITGIAGQDGSYLCEYLLSLGYEIHGMIRRNSTPEHQENRIAHLDKRIKTYYGDLLDPSSLSTLLIQIKPDEIYNLAAQSHVRISYDIPQYTTSVNAQGVCYFLEAYKQYCPSARFYQASSSEMFGSSIDSDGYQREATPMHPVSPYGCAKLFSYSLVKNYRKAYNLFGTNGILFNHESPRRGSNFVTNKVVKGAVMIKRGLAENIELGNLDSSRDWGHAKDYVRAMHMIINHDSPMDFCVATGVSKSVRDMCAYVFSQLGMNYEDYIVQNNKFLRPEELPFLKGDSSKIRSVLGWQPEYTFEQTMDDMLEHWLKEIKVSA
jgi:GDPmannose 4,6-dehydratase